jgi:hypothetical protein
MSKTESRAHRLDAQLNIATCDGYLLKTLTLAGLTWLDAHQERVNQLNVFPVPDGDTGTNMFLTMRKACDEVSARDEPHVGKVCRAIADGALLGARGNSGVILSQWWRGFAEALDGQSDFDGRLFAQACRHAVELAYKAVVKPVEGTILTVTREAMEAVVERAQSNEMNLKTLFETKVNAAYHALQRTPDLLPVLKQAGVVDSGGQGWTFIIEGMLRVLRGEEVSLLVDEMQRLQGQGNWQDALIPEDTEGYGYDVQFLMHGDGLDVMKVRQAISEIGWSALVVGDDRLIKVHVHVHDPGVPISYAIQAGAELDDVVVENMQRQYHRYVANRTAREDETRAPVEGIAVITVAAGGGLCHMFAHDLGAAYVISGGQTMNPSTENFLKAIQKLPNEEIILLPNNPNIHMAARQAASLTRDKKVAVVASRSIPQGVTAMVEYVNGRDSLDLQALTDAMNESLGNVITCEVTRAVRDASLNDVSAREGQYIGLIDDQLAAAGDTLAGVVHDMLYKAAADKRELITLYYGDMVNESDARLLADHLSAEFADQEIQVVNGGQPLYPYIISVE